MAAIPQITATVSKKSGTIDTLPKLLIAYPVNPEVSHVGN
jgi:hypothetical protein